MRQDGSYVRVIRSADQQRVDSQAEFIRAARALHKEDKNMELYFLRHGEAGKKDEWEGEDSERPLSKDGIARMKLEASAISDLDLGLELILTSPLVRARQTADIVARELDMRDRLVIDDRLAPGFGRDALAQRGEEVLRPKIADAGGPRSRLQ